MAVVPVASKNFSTAISIAPISLGASGDTLRYTPNKNEELWLFNTSASVVTVTIDGDAGNTIVVPNTAGTSVSIASGLAITVPANSFAFLPLEKAEAYLQGVVSISASTGSVIRATVVTPY